MDRLDQLDQYKMRGRLSTQCNAIDCGIIGRYLISTECNISVLIGHEFCFLQFLSGSTLVLPT